MAVAAGQRQEHRWRADALALALAVSLVVAVTAGPVSASHAVVESFPSAGSNGWYPTSSVSGTLTFHVGGIVNVPGGFDERIVGVTCFGTGVTGGATPLDGPRFGDLTLPVTISGDAPNPDGITAVCTSQYERRQLPTTLPCCDRSNPWLPHAGPTWQRTFKLDGSPPVNLQATPQGTTVNDLGWYRTPGTLLLTAEDPNSGLLSCSPSTVAIGTVTGATAGVFGCTNGAGLQQTSGYTIRFDATPPTLAPSVSPNPVKRGEPATASPNASDPLPQSGLLSATCNDGNALDTSMPGEYIVTCTATDRAGNQASATATYTVAAYEFEGFGSPVDNTKLNVVKAGQSVPLKFRVLDADGPVTDLPSVTVQADSVVCDLGVTPDVVEESAGKSGLRNLGDGYYQFNWKTPKSYAGSCKLLRLDLGDGIDHMAEFRFTR